MKRTQSPRPEWAKNISEASRLTRISRPTLTGFKRDGCPAFKSNGKINLLELDTWAEFNGKRSAQDTQEMKAERLRILRATAARLERENQVAAGDLILYSEAHRQVAQNVGYLFNVLERTFLRELPPVLSGMDPINIATKCEESISALKRELRAKFDAIGQPAK